VRDKGFNRSIDGGLPERAGTHLLDRIDGVFVSGSVVCDLIIGVS
jgi:hypothetical protein